MFEESSDSDYSVSESSSSEEEVVYVQRKKKSQQQKKPKKFRAGRDKRQSPIKTLHQNQQP